MTYGAFALVLLLPLGALGAPDVIKAPTTISREHGSIVVSDKNGKQRWTAEWTMEPSREQGRSAVRFTETGRGHYYPYPQEIHWSLAAVWNAQSRFSPLRFEKNISDSSGRLIATERKNFDPIKSIVQFDRTRTGGRSERKRLSVPYDTLTVEGIAGVLRFLPFNPWRPLSAHFLTNEPQLYEIRIEMRGTESVKTPAGVFECYKLEIVPQLGILNVGRVFLPKTYFWFSVAAPHFWVRYEGPENGPGTPQIVMELQTYEPER